MDNHDKMADAIVDFVFRALRRKDTPVTRVYVAYYVQANALDPNLSMVRFPDGSIVDGLPRLASSITFAANDQLLLAQFPGVSMTILGKQIGDISALQ